jgi:F-type H+-transporting ATPase subunit delta
MVTGSTARRYAKALFAIGEENNTLLGLFREVQRIAEVWESNDELRVTMTNPLVNRETRRNIWTAVIARLGISPIGKNFLNLIFDKSRFSYLPAIAMELGVLVDEKENRLRAEITTATPVPEAVMIKLKTALQRKTGKAVVITKNEDPSLIGGMVARVGDVMYDGSVKRQLELLKENMLGRI